MLEIPTLAQPKRREIMLEIPTLAQPHVDMMQKRGIEPEALVQKMNDVVKHAWENLDETKKGVCVVFNAPVILGDLEVQLPDARKKCTINCLFCDHVTSAPGDYVIANQKTGVFIKFDDHNLHQITNHFYFGIDRAYVDPIEAGKVLSLL